MVTVQRASNLPVRAPTAKGGSHTLVGAFACRSTRTHTCTHTLIQTHTRSYKHTHRCLQPGNNVAVPGQGYFTVSAHTCAHTHKHTQTHAHSHNHTHIYTRTYTHTGAWQPGNDVAVPDQGYPTVPAHTHTHTLTQTHNHTHTYIHLHTHIHAHRCLAAGQRRGCA